jgi:hypothetical protein
MVAMSLRAAFIASGDGAWAAALKLNNSNAPAIVNQRLDMHLSIPIRQALA